VKLARWWRRRSLRARLTMVTSAGLAVALALAAVLLASALRVALIDGLDVSARQGAVEVATLLNQGRLPSPVPVPPDTVTVQVLNAQGLIVNTSPGADRLVPMLPPAQARQAARTGQARMLAGPPLGLPSVLRVVAVPARGQHVVIAAVSFASARDSLATLARALVIGTPLLFGLLALAIWLVTGYTLRPIAALSRGAAEVTGTGVPRDLPVPPARDEVRALAITLNDMLSRLADAQQRQRDLVSDTAHELRSPIASIRAQLEVALDHPDGLDWAETARDVHADTLRLARLAEDLLLLARLDGQPLRRTPVNLATLCAAAAAGYAAARVPVQVMEQGPGAASCVAAGDPDALRRLLVNLLDNAVRHAASQVCVSVCPEAGWAVLTVTDDGPGIPAADRERAFGRFARLDAARDRTGEEGAGLGLAIVRSIAEAHGGSALLADATLGAAVDASHVDASHGDASHGDASHGDASHGDTGPGLRAVVRLPLMP
jgi:signal transduction histidine kinase